MIAQKRGVYKRISGKTAVRIYLICGKKPYDGRKKVAFSGKKVYNKFYSEV